MKPSSETPNILEENLQGIKNQLQGLEAHMKDIDEQLNDIKARLEPLGDIQNKVTELSEQGRESRFRSDLNFFIAAIVAGVAVVSLGYAQDYVIARQLGSWFSLVAIVAMFVYLYRIRRAIRRGKPK